MTRYVASMLVSLSLLVLGAAHGQGVASAQAERKAGRMDAAARIAMPLAEAGDPEAQRIIGEMYFEGQGLPVSKSAAFKWNLAAANQGDRLAQYSVGYLYETGQGITASKESATEWYRKSALQRYAPAQVKLGDLYRATQNMHLSLYWYEQAMQLGSEEGRARFSGLSTQREAVVAELKAEQADQARAESSALRDECARMCPVATQRARCVAGEHDPSACTTDDYEAVARRPASTSVSAEIQRSMAQIRGSNARITGAHEQMVAGIQAQQAQRERTEAATARAPTQRLDRTAERTPTESPPNRGSNPAAAKPGKEASDSGSTSDAPSGRREPPGPVRASGSNAVAVVGANGRAAEAGTSSASGRQADGDEDGCVAAVSWCSTAPVVDKLRDAVRLRFTNSCPFRVYGEFHNERSDGSVDMGASGVRPGATHTWTTSGGTGRAFVSVIGSTKSSGDWVCHGKKLAAFTWGHSGLGKK